MKNSSSSKASKVSQKELLGRERELRPPVLQLPSVANLNELPHDSISDDLKSLAQKTSRQELFDVAIK